MISKMTWLRAFAVAAIAVAVAQPVRAEEEEPSPGCGGSTFVENTAVDTHCCNLLSCPNEYTPKKEGDRYTKIYSDPVCYETFHTPFEGGCCAL